MSIGKRLFDIARAAIGDKVEELKGKSHPPPSPFFTEETFGNDSSNSHDDFNFTSENSRKSSSYSWDPKHFLTEDLNLFGLGKEAKWEDVKAAYRNECKKYHSDLHQKDVEKKKAAEEIMVILNGGYSRLKIFYNKK